MTKDIVAIPITIIVLEVTFSVGSHIIDKYHAFLVSTTIEMLMYGEDRC